MSVVSHVELNSGNATRVERGEVSALDVSKAAAWLGAALLTEDAIPLPDSKLHGYVGRASSHGDALVVVIAKRDDETSATSGLATIGVARSTASGAQLWPPISKGLPGEAVAAVDQPEAPWCVVSKWSALAEHPQAKEWIDKASRTLSVVWSHHDRLLNHSAEDLMPSAPTVPQSEKLSAEFRSAAAVAWAAIAAQDRKQSRRDGPSLER